MKSNNKIVNLEGEVWKDIPDFPGYKCSNLGRVASYRERNCGHILSQSFVYGYPKLKLRQNGKDKFKYVHQLVAETFIPNPDKLPCINHKDENTTNNCVDNLEWCTRKYNFNYSHCGDWARWANSKPIVFIDSITNEIIHFSSITEASKHFNVSHSCIAHKLRDKKMYKHYIIKFKSELK